MKQPSKIPVAIPTPQPPNHNGGEIAALAYALWQEKGCPDGSAEQDWFQAEHLVADRKPSASATKIHATRRPEPASRKQSAPGAA